MRSLLPVILMAALAGSTAARASAAQASELHDAVRVDASSSALGTVEVVIGALALTASAVVAMVERPAMAGAHDDPRPCDQW